MYYYMVGSRNPVDMFLCVTLWPAVGLSCHQTAALGYARTCLLGCQYVFYFFIKKIYIYMFVIFGMLDLSHNTLISKPVRLVWELRIWLLGKVITIIQILFRKKLNKYYAIVAILLQLVYLVITKVHGLVVGTSRDPPPCKSEWW